MAAELEEQNLEQGEGPGVIGRSLAAFQDMPRQRQLIIGGGALAAIGLAAFFIIQGVTSQGMMRVAAGMEPQQQQDAIKALDAAGIPYELGGGGSVKVPASQVHAARLEIATVTSEGGQIVGFELFDEAELGRTSFNEQVNYHRAREGELARTIGYIKQVSHARVTLQIPKTSLFKEDQAEPSASVLVTLKPGSKLRSKQVVSIQHLVAGAVARLGADRVAVVDQTGRMLAQPGDDDTQAQRLLDQQAQYERSIEKKVMELLEPVVGFGRVRAKVSAKIDFTRSEETSETYDPESQFILSERERTKKSTDASTDPQGAPGAATNVPGPGAQAIRNRTKKSEADELDHIKNYGINRTVNRKSIPHPKVEDIKVAIILDNAVKVVDEDGDKKAIFVPRTKEEMEYYRKTVANTVGIEPAGVEVVNLPFAETPPPPKEIELPPGMWDFPYIFITLFAPFPALFMIWWVMTRRRRRSQQEKERRELEERLRGIQLDPNTLQTKVDDIRHRMMGTAGQDIRTTATVLRQWMTPEKAEG